MKIRSKFLLCFVLVLFVTVALFSLSASADTYYLSTADYCSEMIVFEFYDVIVDSGLSQARGNFAPGLTYDIYWTDNWTSYMVVSGRPTTPGAYWLSGEAIDEDGFEWPWSVAIVVESATPVPTPKPIVYPTITKNPTSETVTEGGSTMFISRADNANYIEWYMVEPNTYEWYTPGAVCAKYPGLSFNGRFSEVFELYNIPMGLSGWQVQCTFSNDYDTVYSSMAKISVRELVVNTPTINTNPQGAEVNINTPVTLSVGVTNNTSGSTLKYQWYSSSTNGGNANPISGANSSSYTPPQNEGTMYYSVAVWSSMSGRDSAKVYSSPTAVTFIKPTPAPTQAPTQAPTAAPTQAPATQAPAGTHAPAATQLPMVSEAPKPAEKSGMNSTMLIIIIAGVVLAAAIIAVIAIIAKKNAEEKEAERRAAARKAAHSGHTWQCSCGALNDGQFCTQCGKTRGGPGKSCSNCGWVDTQGSNPHFCPNCGKPMN